MKKRVLTLLKHFNPISYKELAVESTGRIMFRIFNYFLITVLLLVIVSFFNLGAYSSEFSKINNLGLNITVKSDNQSISMFDNNLIIDLRENSDNNTALNNSLIKITNHKVIWKKYFYLGHAEKKLSELEQGSLSKSEALFLVFLIAPSIVFWFSTALLVKIIIIIITTALLAYIFASIKTYAISFKNALKIALISAPTLYLEPFIALMIRSRTTAFIISLIIYLLLVAIGVFLTSDKELEYLKKERGKGKRKEEKRKNHQKKNPWGLDEY